MKACLVDKIHIQIFFKQLNLFQVIQFSISMQFSSSWPIDRTLSGTTTLDQSEPGSDGSKRVFHIPQTSPLDCLVLYPGHSLGGGGVLIPLQRCSWCILQPQASGQQSARVMVSSVYCVNGDKYHSLIL